MTGEIFMREASLTGMTGREVSLHLASENSYGTGSLFQQPGKREVISSLLMLPVRNGKLTHISTCWAELFYTTTPVMEKHMYFLPNL